MRQIPISTKWWLKWATDRVKKNKNAIIIVNGPTGSGKTYSCISLAVDAAAMSETPFTIEDNLAFKFTDLLKKMQLPQNQKPGTVFVFEEVGAFGGGASSREWRSKANKFFFSFMQTSRHRNQILFMNCPDFSFLEAGARKLVHFQMEMGGINFNSKLAMIKPYQVQINSRTGKYYFKYLRINTKAGQHILNRILVRYPPKKKVAAYEIRKAKFTDSLNQEIINKDEKKKKKAAECKTCEYQWIIKGLKSGRCPKCGSRATHREFMAELT